MFVIADSTLCWKIRDSLPDLQEIIASYAGKKIRRIDRHIQLCVAGALQCANNQQLPSDSAILLASGSGTVSICADIMRTVYVDQHLPKPLHFVNALGNSACFYLSQLLGIQGPSLAVSEQQLSFEAALINANTTFEVGSAATAIVGSADEVLLPIEQHLHRMHASGTYQSMYEGSHWLLLNQKADAKAYAQIDEPQPVDSKAELIEKLAAEQTNESMGRFEKAHFYFNFTPEDTLLRKLSINRQSTTTPDQDAYPHSTFSGHNIVNAVQAIKAQQQASAYIITEDSTTSRLTYTLVSPCR